MKNSKKEKLKAFLYIYALFFVLYFSVVTLARYVSILNIGGKTEVAKWDVSLAGEDEQTLPTITIGDSRTYQDYNLNVTSKSEIAIDYSVILTNVPSNLQVKIDDVLYTPDDNRIIVPNIGSFTANDNETTHTHRLKFMVPIGSDEINSQKVNIDVIFTQVSL